MSRLFPLLIAVFPSFVGAHPLPDIPVRGFFYQDGSAMITVEVDPRCFTQEPEMEGYLMKIQLEKLMSEEDKQALVAQTAAFVKAGVEFFYEPQGKFEPQFEWAFTTLGGGVLDKIDDPVVVTATWRGEVPDGLKGYSIRATESVRHAVVFENQLRGVPVSRTAVLFPGERSFTLALDGSNAAAAPSACCKEGSAPAAGKGWQKWGQSAALLAAVAVLLRFALLKGKTA